MMACKVMSDNEAKDLYKEIMILQHDENEGDAVDQAEFDRFLGRISSNLRELFDLDVRTTLLFHEAVSPPDGKKGTATRYHAFVNRLNDTPARLYGAFNKNPHEIAFFKILLEKLIEKGNVLNEDDAEQSKDEDEDAGENSGRRGRKRTSKSKKSASTAAVTGCRGYLSFMDMLALRSELIGPHEGKLSLSQCQEALEKIIQEKWLVPKLDDSDDDGEDNRRSSTGSTSSKKRRRSHGPKDSAGEATKYQIGPRTYMELDTVLKNMGLNNMPQFIYHK